MDVRKRAEVRTGVVALRVVRREGRAGAVAVPGTSWMITRTGVGFALSLIIITIAAPKPAIRVHNAPAHPYSLKHFVETKIQKLEIKLTSNMEMG